MASLAIPNNYTVVSFLISEKESNHVEQVGVASVVEGKIQPDLYFDKVNSSEGCPSFIEEWDSLQYLLKENYLIVTNKKDLLAFRATLSKYKIQMPVIPNIREVKEIISTEEYERISAIATDARLSASLFASSIMSSKAKVEYDSSQKDELLYQNPFYGKIVVLSGKFSGFDQKELNELLREIGAIVKRSISPETDFFAIGDNPGLYQVHKAIDNLRNDNHLICISNLNMVEIAVIVKLHIEKKANNQKTDDTYIVSRLWKIVKAEMRKDYISTLMQFCNIPVESNLEKIWGDPKNKIYEPSFWERHKKNILMTLAYIVILPLILIFLYKTGLLIIFGIIGLIISGVIKVR